MPRLTPFAALRYDPAIAGPIDALVAPPYDVISAREEARLLARNPHNVVRLEGSAAASGEAEHRAAAELLAAWRAEGVLVGTGPSLYAYEMAYVLGGRPRTTRGVLAALEIEPWGGAVLPHEQVSTAPLGERLGRLRAMRANLSPIHVVLPGPSPLLGAALEVAMRAEPIAEALDDDGVRHRVWSFAMDTAVAAEVGAQACMIADGHHRYTTALAYREEMRALHGAGPWDHVLAFVGDADDAPVLPFHRLVVRGALREPDAEEVSLAATLASLDDDVPRVGLVRTAGGGAVTYGTVDLGAPPPAVEALEPLLPADEDAVRYLADPAEADALVRSGDAVGAWFLPPTTAARVRAAVDAGRRLPRKSTYFWPKPRTGFVLRPFD
ncbi:MAG: DUF1015 family protein [Actinomycetota bacterium]